ncbi:MAG: cysteine desulfurase family protein [Candidatus Thorarchaeota archaeon]
MNENEFVYMDYAASTPMDPLVIEEIYKHFKITYGNASSLHTIGQNAKQVLEDSRKTVASLIHAKPEDVYFTSSGTESDNIAIKGVALQNKKRGNHIITSSIEHHAVENPCLELEKKGFEVTFLPVDRYGLIDLAQLEGEITEKTILISIMFANNEIGTIEPIKEIGQIAKERDVIFHTDAVQAFGKIPIDVNTMNIDLLSVSSHKIYGPKGVGMLYIKNQGFREEWGKYIQPIMHGGSHEKKMRPSTENVPCIAGFAKAVELSKKEMRCEAQRLTKFRDRIITTVLEGIKGSYLNGHPIKRLPNNVHLGFRCIEGETILISLNIENIGASTGSACTLHSAKPSHVLLATGLTPEEATGSLRVTLGRFTTEDEVDYFLEVLPMVIEEIRDMAPLDSWFCCGNRIKI